MKLWSKGYTIAPLIEHYTAANNAALDVELARHDLWGSLAHAAMLRHVGLLDQTEAADLHDALCQLLTQAEQGLLIPGAQQEDIHTYVEQALIELVGETGKKIHTGRSRNDQVLVDVRLYAKESMLGLMQTLLDTSAQLLALARAHEWIPLPGYTHMQRAMLSSVGLWASAYAESLLDDSVALAAAYILNDQSPLGSGAAYGSSLPLDREFTAKALGFARVQHNVLAVANARGKNEAAIVAALSLIMLDLSKFAQDVLLFTTSEYGFVQVPQELCDGSSMMPQKRNLGALELVRARAHTVISLQSQMLSTLAGLPSGYNMDYQETKAPLIQALHTCQQSLEIVALYAQHMQFDEARTRAACSGDLFATDRAYELVRAGVPFRDAYRTMASQTATEVQGELVERLHDRTATGTAGNLGLDELQARISAERAVWQQRQSAFALSIATLVAGDALASTGTPAAMDQQPDTVANNQPTKMDLFFAFAPGAVSRGSLELAFEVAVGI